MRTLADYTANDVTPQNQSIEAHSEYAAHVERWQTELHPNGALECYFAAEIVRAAWRMERYPSRDTSDSANPKILRYRDQTNLGIRRNLEELRRIQSDRYLQAHLGILLPGVASLKIVLPGLKRTKTNSEPAAQPPSEGSEGTRERPSATPETLDPPSVANSEAILHAQIQDEERRQLAEFAKQNPAPTPKPAAPRNAVCPCGSGQKYKHCCGHWSKSGPAAEPGTSIPPRQ